VFLDDYSSLDPMRVPWREVRRHPDRFPDWHIAKVSSVRTVIGLDFAIHTGETRRIYLKRSLQRDKVKQLLARFRATKEWREFQLAQEFAEAGVTVPQPVYYAEGTDENGQPSVYYATIGFGSEWHEAKSLFKKTRQFGAEWQSLARFTRRLHEKGVLHGDYRSDHIYLDEGSFAEGDDSAWALMDLDGSRVGKPVTPRERFRALTQLTDSLLTSGMKRENVEEFLRVYDPANTQQLDSRRIYKFALDKVKRLRPR